MYKLKNNQPDFEVVDGPYAGRKYKAGVVYQDIPPEENQRFDAITMSASTEESTEPEILSESESEI